MPILLEYRKKKRNSLTIKLKQADWTIVKEIDRKKRKGVASRHALISTSCGLPLIPYGNYGNAEVLLLWCG